MVFPVRKGTSHIRVFHRLPQSGSATLIILKGRDWKMNLDGKDPIIEEAYDEMEGLETLVWNGHLTEYGERRYEESRTLAYDEIDGKWIYV